MARGPVEWAANVQLSACIPNFLILESIGTGGGFHAGILKKPMQWQDGYVIVPDAPAKLYVTASQEARATRRWRQLVGLGEETAYEDILADVRKRDDRDAARAAAPMRPAADAVLLDTTDLDIDSAFEAARRIVENARVRWESSRQG